MNKKWTVHLTIEERNELEGIVKKGKSPARMIRRAQTLLLADEKKSDQEIASVLRCSKECVYSTRRTYCEYGLQQSLVEKARSGRPEKLVGKAKAHLIALACSEAPEGRACWTMQLLADRCVTLELTDSISDETVRRTLKKTK